MKRYKKGDYCKSIGCQFWSMLEQDDRSECESCRAYQFHNFVTSGQGRQEADVVSIKAKDTAQIIVNALPKIFLDISRVPEVVMIEFYDQLAVTIEAIVRQNNLGILEAISKLRVPPGLLIEKALSLIVQYGGIAGAHHKQWLIDQIVMNLTDDYDDWVATYQEGGDGADTYEWDKGIAP